MQVQVRTPRSTKKMQKKIYAPIAADVEKVGKTVLDAAFKVHTALGPGLLESVYETCTAFEIREMGLRLDMLVENCVIVEFKSVENMNPIYEAQLLTYLKLTGLRLGFLINFNVVRLKDGIKRMVI